MFSFDFGLLRAICIRSQIDKKCNHIGQADGFDIPGPMSTDHHYSLIVKRLKGSAKNGER